MEGFSLPRIHPAGWPFIGAFIVAAILLSLVSDLLGVLGAVAAAWCIFFFRDPDRVPPEAPNVVVSPADGVVQAIAEAPPPPELDMGAEPRPRVSVFLNIFDVHVNRIPASGVITRAAYRPGKFFNASFDKASELNERMAVSMRTAWGHDLAFVQIAGLVARRIQCDLTEGQSVHVGDRFGIIRFGSRMDVYLPAGYRVMVRKGQRAVAGETIIAEATTGPGA